MPEKHGKVFTPSTKNAIGQSNSLSSVRKQLACKKLVPGNNCGDVLQTSLKKSLISSPSRNCPVGVLINLSQKSPALEVDNSSKEVQDLSPIVKRKHEDFNFSEANSCLKSKNSDFRLHWKTPSPQSMSRISKEASKVIQHLNSSPIFDTGEDILLDKLVPIPLCFDTSDTTVNEDLILKEPPENKIADAKISVSIQVDLDKSQPEVQFDEGRIAECTKLVQPKSNDLSKGVRKVFTPSTKNAIGQSNSLFSVRKQLACKKPVPGNNCGNMLQTSLKKSRIPSPSRRYSMYTPGLNNQIPKSVPRTSRVSHPPPSRFEKRCSNIYTPQRNIAQSSTNAAIKPLKNNNRLNTDMKKMPTKCQPCTPPACSIPKISLSTSKKFGSKFSTLPFSEAKDDPLARKLFTDNIKSKSRPVKKL